MILDEQSKEIAFFSEFVSEHKKALFQQILDYRTRFMTVVLEDIYKPQNASAVLRSCDGFGVQDVHIIENRNYFDIDKGVTIGSHKWLNLIRYNKRNSNNTENAFNRLRIKGYQIIAVTPHSKQVPLSDFKPQKPFALVFGTEKMGLSPFALDNADERIFVPMYGFSESFNLSVCVALCLFHFRRYLIESPLPWKLNIVEKNAIYLQWLRKSLQHLEALEKRFNEIHTK